MVLPILLDCETGESLRSFIDRLADNNHLRPDELGEVPGPHLVPDLSVLSEHSGVPAETLSALTWNGYPTSVVGARGSTGWLLRRARWWCPSCQPQAHIWQRNWEVACLPACLECNRTLASNPFTDTNELNPTEISTFTFIEGRLEQSRTDRRIAVWFGRLLRVARLLAITCDKDWPQPLDEAVVPQLNGWGHHPPDAPAALAQHLTFVSRLVNTRREPDMVAEAWIRLRYRQRTIATTLLPKPPQRGAEDKPPRGQRLTGQLLRQRAIILRNELDGMDVNTIPALMPTHANAFLPAEDDWPSAQRMALAIHMLARPKRGGRPGSFNDSARHFHLPSTRPTSMLVDLEERFTITAPDADRLRGAMTAWMGVAPVDYHLRRDLLISLNTPPRFPKIDLPTPILGGWLWVYLTHGRVVTTGPWWTQIDHLLPTRVVVQNHERLSLEARMILAEYADDLWLRLSNQDLNDWADRPSLISPRASHVTHS